MVLIKDARREFLEKIKHKRVLVFVYLDVDGICAWKILQHLLKCEEILHTIVPIDNKSSLEEYYSKHRQAADNVILVNCGATINLVETLKPSDEVVFYVIDSWRPFEVKNVFNGVQVKILVAQDDLETENQRVPEFEDLFEDEEEEKSSDNDEGNESDEEEEDEEEETENDDEEEADSACEQRGRDRKRQRLEKEVSRKKKIVNKREWQEKRNKILFEYYKYIYHGCSASLVLFDLAWKVAKDNNDLLWWAIVGITEQLINSKIDKELYLRYKMNLDSHVMRLNHRPTNPLANSSNQAQTSNDDLSINCLKISTMDDLNMCLYRHWSIMESINHSIDLACLFKVWQAKGKKKLNEFLADLGLPLNECKQKFSFMDSSHKNDFVSLVASENIKEKYKYDESLIYVSTYIATFGYCNRYSAFDMAYAVEALISNDDLSKSVSDRFIDGLNCLTRENEKAFEVGLEMAKNHLKKMFSQLQNFIDMNQVVASGSFLQVFIDESNTTYFAQPLTCKKIARYALQSYLALTKGKRVRSMPLVLCVRLNDEYSLITGIPPYKASNNTENCFGLAFDEAAESSNSRVTFNSFDTSIIEINNEDKSKFLDALVVVMQ